MAMAAYDTPTSISARTHERLDTFKVRQSRWTPDHNTRPALAPRTRLARVEGALLRSREAGRVALPARRVERGDADGPAEGDRTADEGAAHGGLAAVSRVAQGEAGQPGLPPRLSLLAALASGRALSPASTARVPPRVRASASRAVRRARGRSLRRRDACRGPGPRARPPPSPPALRPPPPRLPPPRARAAAGPG